MKRTYVATLLCIGLAVPSWADVTIKMTTGGKALGMSGKAAGTTYIKGNKMRSDLQIGDKTFFMRVYKRRAQAYNTAD